VFFSSKEMMSYFPGKTSSYRQSSPHRMQEVDVIEFPQGAGHNESAEKPF
jgi:hypothetical protein